MGIQLIIDTDHLSAIEDALGTVASGCEIFPIELSRFGVSVPTKVVDELGEDELFKLLRSLRYYNLWSGNWVEPKPKWKFW